MFYCVNFSKKLARVRNDVLLTSPLKNWLEVSQNRSRAIKIHLPCPCWSSGEFYDSGSLYVATRSDRGNGGNPSGAGPPTATAPSTAAGWTLPLLSNRSKVIRIIVHHHHYIITDAEQFAQPGHSDELLSSRHFGSSFCEQMAYDTKHKLPRAWRACFGILVAKGAKCTSTVEIIPAAVGPFYSYSRLCWQNPQMKIMILKTLCEILKIGVSGNIVYFSFLHKF